MHLDSRVKSTGDQTVVILNFPSVLEPNGNPLCVSPHGRWSPRSCVLEAARIQFHVFHQIPQSVSPCVSASPEQESTPTSFLSSSPPSSAYPWFSARLQRHASLAGLRSINRASITSSNWIVVSDPPHPHSPTRPPSFLRPPPTSDRCVL